MIHDQVGLIIPVRNREPSRIQRLVSSLKYNEAGPTVLLVDYGSDLVFSTQYRILAENHGILYKRLFADGLPWNKCHAINYGVKALDTQFIATADVDICFNSNPFQYCLDNSPDKKMFHIQCFWMDKSHRLDTAKAAGRSAPGGFQLVQRQAFFESNGYDEKLVYWGQEDLDWPNRLTLLGYEQVWLPEPHRVYHQWHNPSEGGALRPATATYNTMTNCMQNVLVPKVDQEWGCELNYNDRPILECLKSNNAKTIELKDNELSKYGNDVKLIAFLMINKFCKVRIGERLIKRPLFFTQEVVATILKPVVSLSGLELNNRINRNFEYIYSLIPMLMKNGLKDYYISSDLSEIAFLMR